MLGTIVEAPGSLRHHRPCLSVVVVVVVVVYFTSQILTGKLPNNKKAKAKKIILILIHVKEITGAAENE